MCLAESLATLESAAGPNTAADFADCSWVANCNWDAARMPAFAATPVGYRLVGCLAGLTGWDRRPGLAARIADSDSLRSSDSVHTPQRVQSQRVASRQNSVQIAGPAEEVEGPSRYLRPEQTPTLQRPGIPLKDSV